MNKKYTLTAIAAAIVCSGTAVSAQDPVYIKEGSTQILVDGLPQQTETAPVNIDGRVYVPVREFSALLGRNVFWKNGVIMVGEQSEQELADMMNDNFVNGKYGETAEPDYTQIREIKKILRRSLYDASADPSDALAHWQEDGSFEGVEYFNSDVMVWSAKKHLDYLLTMVKAAYSEGNSCYNNAELKGKIEKSLDYWATCGRVECDNWWQQEIGVPGVAVNILIMEPEELSELTRSTLNAEAARGSIFNEAMYDRITERPVASTGANLADKLLTSFNIAIATENEDEVYNVMHLLENELRIFYKVRTDEYGEDSDGIKADYSFHQHVDQIQSTSYGEILVKDSAKLISYVKGTKYMISDYALNEFANFLLDGQQYMFRGGYREITTAGRSVIRPSSAAGMRDSMIAAVNALEGLTQIERYDELMKLKADRLGDTDGGFEANRHFWLSDYMSHNRSGYHLGIKLASNRTKSGEVINNENLLGYYLSDGVTTIMQDGDEYYDIFPVWDWNRLPGTTTPQGGLKNLNDWAEWNGEHLWNWKGNNSFVGGVSDGRYGAAVMDYTRDGLDAKKSWFMFDDEMIALGNGINSYTDMDIYTNINQCVLDGEVKADGKTLGEGTHTVNGGYILHDGVGYITSQPAEIKIEERSGSWGTVNGGYADVQAKMSVFEIGIHHGVKPSDAQYEYRVVFNADEGRMNAEMTASNYSVIRNDDKVQAVYDKKNKICQAIVWKMDKIELPGGLTVETNKKCALIIKELENGGLEITASNPTNEAKALTLTLNRTLPDGTNIINFRLNEGVYAGSSTTYSTVNGFDEFKTTEKIGIYTK